MVLGNLVPPNPADHELKSDLHCPENRRAECLIKTRHSVLPASYITWSQTTNTKQKNPAMPLKGETNVREGGGTDPRETLGCHINTCGMDPESMTVLLAHLYTSLCFKLRNSDVNAFPSLTKVSSCIKLCRGLGLCFL